MSEPTDDKITWYHNSPERSSIKSFTREELVDELSKREGVTTTRSKGSAVWGTTLEEINGGTAKYTKRMFLEVRS